MSDTHAALQHIARLADDALHTKSRDIADWLDDMETVQRIARAALAQAEAAQPADLASENAELRHLLAVRVAGALLYADDGELSDASELPAIDFKRDAPGEIARKMWDRGLKKLTTAEAALKQAEVLSSGAVSRALSRPECQRLSEWAQIGPVQRAAVESFADALLPAQPQQPAPQPVAWQGPSGQLMPHEIFVAWRARFPQDGHEHFRPLVPAAPQPPEAR